MVAEVPDHVLEIARKVADYERRSDECARLASHEFRLASIARDPSIARYHHSNGSSYVRQAEKYNRMAEALFS